ncbi:hypothetical protein C7M84_007355 [Penaeus vannamei]|uniref:Peptidase A2 domain-containing protein n=1 Tax=Penaeus vannamei TaxID=6689 RepID=A0A423UAP7_PENVA|nr:hypothetical protein C7M84_007355 [Penaeus vannamei]
MINAFIDTGSEATLLKHSAQTLIAPSRTSEPRRRLQGASGASLAITGERDVILQINDQNIVTHRVCIELILILIGIDLLKRLDFRLGYDSRTNNSYLRLRGKAFTVRYVNKDSLELTAVVMKMKGMSVPVPPARAAIRRSVSCPPESGRFVPVRVPDALIGKQLLVEGLGYSVILPREVIKPSSKEAVVWVVNPTLNPVKLRNGTHLVELHEVEEMCDTPEAPGNVASIADTPVAAVPTSALEKISLQHLSDHRDKFAIGKFQTLYMRSQHKRSILCVSVSGVFLKQLKGTFEYAAYHNRNLRPPWSLEAGSLVLYKIKTTQTGPDRALGPRWQGPAKVVKKLGPVNYVVQDLSPPFSERNCHANQLRPFKLEEELTFPDASPYHDPDYVDPWLPDDAEPDHSNTSTSCGLSSETDVARTTNSARPYLELPECPGPPLLYLSTVRVPLDLSAQHSQQPPFDVVAASLRSAHARRPVGLAREAL